MKNTFGNSISLTLFGESHGEIIGAVLDGLAPGILVNEEEIASFLALRRPSGSISTSRIEADKFKIVSGVFKGYTTGTPLTILIPNENTKSGDYERTANLARPGHADFTANEKYHGYEDYRGGGHFSGRITAPIVAAGAILISALRSKGIRIGSHILSLADVCDRPFDEANAENDIALTESSAFSVLDESSRSKMIEAINDAKSKGDSVGGVLETLITGLPSGVGEPWFDSLEGMLSHAIFSIPAVKGIEFGAGFSLAKMLGSEANDQFRITNEKIETVTNNNGGINGGISNGMPIRFKTAIKPTPSISIPQNTVDLLNGENSIIEIVGRHDPAIIHRARIVVDAITALVLADMLSTRFGTDYLANGQKDI